MNICNLAFFDFNDLILKLPICHCSLLRVDLVDENLVDEKQLGSLDLETQLEIIHQLSLLELKFNSENLDPNWPRESTFNPCPDFGSLRRLDYSAEHWLAQLSLSELMSHCQVAKCRKTLSFCSLGFARWGGCRYCHCLRSCWHLCPPD